jgi:cytoskeletal protein CcmA (bactofilin family)
MRRTLLFGLLLLCWLVPAGHASAAVDGKSGDDRIVVVGSVLVDRDEVAGDVIVVDGDVTVRGTVQGDLVVLDGNITIRGTVEGNVVAASGLATLGRRGHVEGDLVYGDEKPVQAPGSQVDGKVEKFSFGDVSVLAAIGLWIGFTISLLLLGIVLLLIAPRAGEAIARTGKDKPGISAGVGLLAFFLLPIIAIAACLTVIGLPLGIVLLLLILPLYAIGYLSAALVVGRLILKKSKILALLVGLVILQLLTLIPIAGGIIGFLATVFGLGVLLVTLFRARS